MNIIWKRSDGGISVTHLTNEAGSIAQEATKLKENGSIPADWEQVADSIELPTDRHFREAWTWTTPEPVIDICPIKAMEVTKNRLRAERLPLLSDLDIQYMRALESQDDAAIALILTEKQRLRDITTLVDNVNDLDSLRLISI